MVFKNICIGKRFPVMWMYHSLTLLAEFKAFFVWSQPLKSYINLIWSIIKAKKLRSSYQRLEIGSGLQAWSYFNASAVALWRQCCAKEFMSNLALISHDNLTLTNKLICLLWPLNLRKFIPCLCSCRTSQRSFIAWNHYTLAFQSILIFAP